jgi:hypothetical protein
MATTLSTAARNAACDATVDLLDAGSGAGKLRLKSAGAVVIGEATLDDPAFGGASSGQASMAGTPISGTGNASAGAGTAAATFEFTDSDDNVVLSGNVGTGTGELDLDNVSIANGQGFTVTGFTHTQPSSA